MPRRQTRVAIAGNAPVTPPTSPLNLSNDGYSAPADTSAFDMAVLANDTPQGGIRLVSVAPTLPLPAANIAITGTEPNQKLTVNRAGLAPGVYSATYTAALIADPDTPAKTAVVNLTITAVQAPSIDARDDAASVVAGASVDVPVLANDIVVGVKQILSVTPGPGLSAANLSIVGSAPNQQVRVNAAGLASGTYSFTYRAALTTDSTVFDDATVVLAVTAQATIDARDDSFSAVVGTGTLDLAVLANDIGTGDKRISSVTAIAPLPQSVLAIVGTVPDQMIRVDRSALAAGSYQFTYRAELVADANVFDIATATMSLTSGGSVTANDRDTLSVSVSASPLMVNVLGNDTGTGQLRIAAVTAGSGLTDARLSISGTPPSQQVRVDRDGLEAGSYTFTYRLELADDATVFDTATETFTLTDDTVTPPTDAYDENLAFGGLMLGAAVHDGSIGNLAFAKDDGGVTYQVVYLESLLPIACVQTELRYDKFRLGSTAGGYSDKTVIKNGGVIMNPPDETYTPSNSTVLQYPQGGDVRMRVAKVTSGDSTDTLTLGPYAKNTSLRINRCATAAGWGPDHLASGGDGTPPEDHTGGNSFLMYPTIWFRDDKGDLAPIDPKDPAGDGSVAAWKIGDRIAFAFDNTAPGKFPGKNGTFSQFSAPDLQTPDRWTGTTRYSSLNQANRLGRRGSSVGDPMSSYPLLRNGGCWQNGLSKRRLDYMPVIIVGHKRANGTLLKKGHAYCGYAGASEFSAGNSAGDGIRQVLYIPSGWTGRKIIAADVSVFRNGSSGTFTVAIRKAGSTPVANTSSDDGKLVGSQQFTSAINASKPQLADGDAHRRCDLSTTEIETVTAGDAYFVELAIVSGSVEYEVGRMLNYFGRQPLGLHNCDHEDRRNFVQRRSGTGNWTRIDGAATTNGNYTIAGMSLHFDGAV